MDADKLDAGGRGALEWACANKIMRRTGLRGRVMDLESVKFWIAQLNSPKTRNIASEKGTRQSYVASLEAFNAWMQGRKFPVRKDDARDGGTAGTGTTADVAFANVEEMLRFCEGPGGSGALAAKRAVRQYLADLAVSECSLSTAMVRCAAIKSYFATHDVVVDVRVNRRRHAPAGSSVREGGAEMSLPDFYRMVSGGGMGITMRTIALVKF